MKNQTSRARRKRIGEVAGSAAFNLEVTHAPTDLSSRPTKPAAYAIPLEIFLCDESAVHRGALAQILTENGNHVSICGSATELASLLQFFGKKPDLLIVDADTVGFAGEGLMEQLAALRFSAPVVVLANFCQTKSRDYWMLLGANICIEKSLAPQIMPTLAHSLRSI